jgi:arylsulfatase A-like enzyme
MFDPADIALRPNVPEEMAEQARRDLAGYYAHIAALDDCMGDLEGTLDETGLAENTVFLFTSDHGDMLYSQGAQKKQRPYEESIVCPFLLRYPAKLGRQGRAVDTVLNTPDIMPTLLGLCGVDLPDGVEGEDFSAQLLAGQTPDKDAALLMCPQPFGQWTRAMGGREYRGVRTKRYAYCRTLDGPWLLYDNAADPYQLHNRVNDPELAGIQAELEMTLNRKLEETNDRFEPGPVLLERWGYEVDETGTVPYAP